MKNLIILSALIVLMPLGVAAQDEQSPPHSQTSAPATSRFEIVQSHLAAKWTFLLDKYSGAVYQLVTTKDDGLAWENIPVKGLPKPTTPSRVRYQLFTSGIAARHTFLINIETSKTWYIVNTKDEKGNEILAWEPFDDN